jgi:hypothetical protein
MTLLIAILVGLAPVQYGARPGWHVGHDHVHACPGVPRSRCEQVTSWASTVAFRDCGECLPHRTLDALPRNGVVIQLMLGRDRKPYFARALRWPARGRAGAGQGPIEGGPQRIGSVQLSGRLDGSDAYLFVFFGRRDPTARQLARANAELRSATLP